MFGTPNMPKQRKELPLSSHHQDILLADSVIPLGCRAQEYFFRKNPKLNFHTRCFGQHPSTFSLTAGFGVADLLFV